MGNGGRGRELGFGKREIVRELVDLGIWLNGGFDGAFYCYCKGGGEMGGRNRLHLVLPTPPFAQKQKLKAREWYFESLTL